MTARGQDGNLFVGIPHRLKAAEGTELWDVLYTQTGVSCPRCNKCRGCPKLWLKAVEIKKKKKKKKKLLLMASQDTQINKQTQTCKWAKIHLYVHHFSTRVFISYGSLKVLYMFIYSWLWLETCLYNKFLLST